MAIIAVRHPGTGTDPTSTLQGAIDDAHAQGGGTVWVDPGEYVCGSLELKSGVTLHLEAGAVLRASPDHQRHHVLMRVGALAGGDTSDHAPDVGEDANARAFLWARDAHDVAITGLGEIDGAGRDYVAEDLTYIYRMRPGRPFTLFFIGCQRLTFRDVRFTDGALWTVRLSGCRDVLIHSLRIDNDLKVPNSDGIDLDCCQNVRISDCYLVCGDDAIALKATVESAHYGPCENITVTGCTLVSTSSALMIGCECRVPMRNVVFADCVIRDSHRGVYLHLSEESDIEDVLVSNLVIDTRFFHDSWWGRGEPIGVVALPWDEHRGIGTVRRVRFSHILCRSEGPVLLIGAEGKPLVDIRLEDVRLEIQRRSKWPDTHLDLRPCPGDQMPQVPFSAIMARNVQGLRLRNVDVVWGDTVPENYVAPVQYEDVEDLVTHDCRFPER